MKDIIQNLEMKKKGAERKPRKLMREFKQYCLEHKEKLSIFVKDFKIARDKIKELERAIDILKRNEK